MAILKELIETTEKLSEKNQKELLFIAQLLAKGEWNKEHEHAPA